MKMLLLGAGGQLGYELCRTCPDSVKLSTCDFPKVDFNSEASLVECIDAADPDMIINAAAYTAVDQAEQDVKQAYRINSEAVAILARQARERGTGLVHISTDFVFSGKNHRPYTPLDDPAPESVYGLSKLEGEKAVRDIMGDRALIVRTAWLYSSHGKNFVKTMLDLMANRELLTVIDEQVGTPTWARGLAHAVWAGLDLGLTGIYHWTDAGVASWYDFAVAIQEEALALGLLDHAIPVMPVPASKYPTPAPRPFYSVMDKTGLWSATGITPVHWRVQLRAMLRELVS